MKVLRLAAISLRDRGRFRAYQVLSLYCVQLIQCSIRCPRNSQGPKTHLFRHIGQVSAIHPATNTGMVSLRPARSRNPADY